MTKYDDFSDISKRDKGALVIKIIIFIIIIVLVLGAVYILNDILNLGLF
jgi:flagellar basal body-associated protein FliL